MPPMCRAPFSWLPRDPGSVMDQPQDSSEAALGCCSSRARQRHFGELPASLVSCGTSSPRTILFSNISAIWHQTTRPNFQPRKHGSACHYSQAIQISRPEDSTILDGEPSPIATTWGRSWLKADVPPPQTRFSYLVLLFSSVCILNATKNAREKTETRGVKIYHSQQLATC